MSWTVITLGRDSGTRAGWWLSTMSIGSRWSNDQQQPEAGLRDSSARRASWQTAAQLRRVGQHRDPNRPRGGLRHAGFKQQGMHNGEAYGQALGQTKRLSEQVPVSVVVLKNFMVCI
ncbi:hypothetical protein HPP92_029055 [Vanilla planifolia]|uniref:Uncharacterized protein n=1 Tax=Vanilla planifolia TaxID=51239 RepID=A0A835U229_VANPL|nr:hypothetical protein HPP92_029055 [Vanilla planifolia]KAG0446018.1 hypothetical protein HPP92_029044 [Vanilla planifolia]